MCVYTVDKTDHLSYSLSVISSNDASAHWPALLTSRSTGRIDSTAFCTASQLVTSAHTGIMPGHCKTMNELNFLYTAIIFKENTGLLVNNATTVF